MFKKGQSGNISGRPIGALNEKTKASISRAQRWIDTIESHPRWTKILENITDKEMLDWHKDLHEYLESKRSRVEHSDENTGPRIVRVIHSLEAPQQSAPIIEDVPYTIISPANIGTKPF